MFKYRTDVSNGLPLVVIELKNPADENATIKAAYQQLQTYKQFIPSLFSYNGFMLISDGLEAKAGSLSAGLSRFMTWKSSDGKIEASHLIGQLETLIYYAVNRAVESTLRAAGYISPSVNSSADTVMESPESYGVAYPGERKIFIDGFLYRKNCTRHE